VSVLEHVLAGVVVIAIIAIAFVALETRKHDRRKAAGEPE